MITMTYDDRLYPQLGAIMAETDNVTHSMPVTIARIEVKLDNALLAITDHKRETTRTLNDHEQRLRAGERWRWAIPLTLLVALVSAGGSYANLFGH